MIGISASFITNQQPANYTTSVLRTDVYCVCVGGADTMSLPVVKSRIQEVAELILFDIQSHVTFFG